MHIDTHTRRRTGRVTSNMFKTVYAAPLSNDHHSSLRKENAFSAIDLTNLSFENQLHTVNRSLERKTEYVKGDMRLAQI